MTPVGVELLSDWLGSSLSLPLLLLQVFQLCSSYFIFRAKRNITSYLFLPCLSLTESSFRKTLIHKSLFKACLAVQLFGTAKQTQKLNFTVDTMKIYWVFIYPKILFLLSESKCHASAVSWSSVGDVLRMTDVKTKETELREEKT